MNDDKTNEVPDDKIKTGREDFEERKEARIERHEQRAAKARAESEQTMNSAREMADGIPFGQPILVGHHSEKRDRNYRDKIQKKFRKGSELQSKAKHYEDKAKAAEGSTAISSDDPVAVVKLREKIERLEAYQTRMKTVNAAHRRFVKNPASLDKASNISDADKQLIRNYTPEYSWEPNPVPPYALTNNNVNLRRCKKRLDELRATHNRETVEADHGVCKLVEDAEDNRVQLFFDGKPSEEVRRLLKSNGFRWARSVGAWQRLLNNAGMDSANYVIERIKEMEQ